MVQVQIKLMIITPMIIDVDRFYIIKPSCWIPTILYQQKWKKGFVLLGLACNKFNKVSSSWPTIPCKDWLSLQNFCFEL